MTALRKEPVVNDNVGAMPVLLLYSSGSDTAAAYSRAVGRRTLTFKAGAPGSITDNETGSSWTAHGECAAGKFKGQRLERIIAQPGLWFAWAEFNPDTEVYAAAVH